MSVPTAIPLPIPIVVNHTVTHRDPDRPINRMSHPTHTIGIVTRGEGTYEMGDWKGPIGAPAIGILPAGETDGNGLTGDWESWFCCFLWPGVPVGSNGQGDVLAQLPGGDLALAPNLSVDAAAAVRVAQQFAELQGLLEQHGTVSQLRAASLLLTLILDYAEARRTATTRTGHRSLAVFHELLCEHACEPLSLREMSRQAGLSPDHLRDLFVREFGQTPQQFRLEIRLARGRDLLTAGRTVREAADLCGFADASYFSRAFLKQYGIRPTALIHRCRIQ